MIKLQFPEVRHGVRNACDACDACGLNVALVAGSVTLFVANPLVAPLFMLGWGVYIGGLAGAAIGVDKPKAKKEGPLSELVLDVIRAGHVVLIAHTRSAQETQMVRNVIGDSVVFSPHI